MTLCAAMPSKLALDLRLQRIKTITRFAIINAAVSVPVSMVVLMGLCLAFNTSYAEDHDRLRRLQRGIFIAVLVAQIHTILVMGAFYWLSRRALAVVKEIITLENILQHEQSPSAINQDSEAIALQTIFVRFQRLQRVFIINGPLHVIFVVLALTILCIDSPSTPQATAYFVPWMLVNCAVGSNNYALFYAGALKQVLPTNETVP